MKNRLGALGWIGLVFALVGLGLLLPACVMLFNTLHFRLPLRPTEGHVVSVEKRCEQSQAQSCADKLSIRYVTASGESRQFVATGDWSFSTGDALRVLYDPAHPDRAFVDAEDWQDRWMPTLILCGMGLVFSAIGVPLFWFALRALLWRSWARKHGQPIQSDYVRTERRTNIEINGQNPYRIVSQWHNPADNRLYVFYSQDMMWSPADEMSARARISVRIDPRNPKCYWMDLDFLPQPA